MRLFINLFLILFAADGLISVVDELLVLFAGASNLSGVRNLFANAVILLSLPVYLSLGVDRRLPKRVLLPLIAFIVWTLLATWFFPSLSESSSYSILCAIAQLLLCLLPVEYARRIGGQGLLLPLSAFTPPLFNFRHTLLFAAASIFIVPAVFVLCTLASADAYADKATSGFIRIAPSGVYMSERIYRKDHKTIRLTSMIHVGDQKFYDDLTGSISVGKTIILAEGVTDEKQLLKNKFGHSKMAGFLGLSSQEKMRLKGRIVKSADGADSEPETDGPAGNDILRADIDISDFNRDTIAFLNSVGKRINEGASFVATFMALNEWAEKELTPELNQTIMDDILHKRSKALISHLDIALANYETVVVPWGALHMSEIEEAVLKRGFVLHEKKYRVSIDFWKMFLAMLPFGNSDKQIKKP
jgi:hypothetical protein